MQRRYVLIGGGLSVLLLALGLGLYASWIALTRHLDQPFDLHEPLIFDLAPGTSLSQLGSEFARRGWLPYAFELPLGAQLHQLSARIQAGTYEINPGETPRLVLKKFAQGRVIIYSVTFVEGRTFGQLQRQLASLPGLRLELSGTRDGEIMRQVTGVEGSPEGRFFPSTYFYLHHSTDLALLRRSYHQQTEILQREWDQRAGDLPYRSADEALIMASIIERETGAKEERAQIAGVFVRRLQRSMKLQTDPTVIYGLGAAFSGRLRRADLERDTPYNTYTRSGLPPSPICAPGAAAIHAALHPAAGDALYFVARGDGTHVFSNTLTAHNEAVRTYQLGTQKP